MKAGRIQGGSKHILGVSIDFALSMNLLLGAWKKKIILVELEFFALLLFFFNWKTGKMGMGNDLNCLGCFTSRSLNCTENRRVQQQIHNFKFIEVHVALKASLAQLVHVCLKKKKVSRSKGLKFKNKPVSTWIKHQLLPMDVVCGTWDGALISHPFRACLDAAPLFAGAIFRDKWQSIKKHGSWIWHPISLVLGEML